MICCLQGGMGNQMFQYAMAKAASLRLNADLRLNLKRFENDRMRQYTLGLWKIVTNGICNDEPNRIVEDGLPYNESLLKRIHADSSLIGYWQTERYFKDIKHILKEEFTPRQNLTSGGFATEKMILDSGNRSVFLTVRRTDYVSSNFHGVLSMEYYNKALDIIASQVPNPIIFVFSDEPEWCKINLKFSYQTIIAGNYDITTGNHLGREDEELWLMRNCKHAVMANSSYSWWGAWLNDTGIVVAPQRWFLSNEKDSSDIIPERWIKI